VSYPPQAGTRVHTHESDPQGGVLGNLSLPGLATHEALATVHQDALVIAAALLATHAALPTVHQDAPALVATHEADVDAHHPVDIGARVYNSADQELPNNTWTALAFDSERYNTDTIHSTSSNTNRLTCKTAGKYFIHAQVKWEGNASGGRYVSIKHSSGWHIGRGIATELTGSEFIMSVQTVWDLAVDEYVEIELWQGSGVALDSKAEAKMAPEFMMQRIED